MKRRSFLQFLGLAPAAAALPALAAKTRAVGMIPELGMGYGEPVGASDALEAAVLQGTTVTWHQGHAAWLVHAQAPLKDGLYEWATLHQDLDRPTQKDMARYHEVAMHAFRRAERMRT